MREIAQSVDIRRLHSNKAPRKERTGISFVKAEYKKNEKAKTEPARCYLDGATDWQLLQIDMDGKLKVPGRL